jgi:hypothetical protein
VTPRKITAIYTGSDDPNFGEPIHAEVVLLASDLLMEVEGDEWTFLLIPKVADEECTVEVDRAKCWHFGLGIMHDCDTKIDYEYLAECSFLDFIRRYGKK